MVTPLKTEQNNCCLTPIIWLKPVLQNNLTNANNLCEQRKSV